MTVLVLHALRLRLNSVNARIFLNPIVARVAPPVAGLAFQKASSFPREKICSKIEGVVGELRAAEHGARRLVGSGEASPTYANW